MLKLPRKYTANGIDLRIAHNKDLSHEGGRFSFKGKRIEINVDKHDDMFVLQALIHEEVEATLVGLGCRYTNHNSEDRFSFDHNVFCAVCNEVARGVLDLLAANRGK